jgi:uncharacterized protein (TIGR00162 family)
LDIEVFSEKPQLKKPVLIEALPGIGFVANIVGLHLIKETKAKPFCTIHLPSFQAIALTTENGGIRPPMNELYYAKTEAMNDIVILHGNTQALNVEGQYDLAWRILDVVRSLSCQTVVTIGGLKRDSSSASPKVYCTATDKSSLEGALRLGASTLTGSIYGAAGILPGLARLRKMNGYCILVETPGLYPDALAARVALDFLSRFLGLTVDVSGLDKAVEATQMLLGKESKELTIDR